MRRQITMWLALPLAALAPEDTALRLRAGWSDAVAKLSVARLVDDCASAVSATSERYLKGDLRGLGMTTECKDPGS
jgi:hypothetical protein